jgi:broad specificity phosphatase PhoE
MKLILVRHTEPEYTNYDSSQNPSLSEYGRQQAIAISNLLSNERIDIIFSTLPDNFLVFKK